MVRLRDSGLILVPPRSTTCCTETPEVDPESTPHTQVPLATNRVCSTLASGST